MAQQNIVFAGGGTAGHLFPGLAVADELRRRHESASIVFVGARRGIEQRLVPRAGYPLRSLRLSGLKGRGAAGRIGAALAAGWAVAGCLGWMVRRRPRLVVGLGGYASGPAVMAATLLRVRRMLIEQNHFPGATNRWLAPRVDAVCLPSEAARERLGGRGIVTGNPVRPEFTRIGVSPNGPRLSLLVFGGSRGARSINRALEAALPLLAAQATAPHVVHQTGMDDEERMRAAAVRYPSGAYEVHAFLDDMPARLAAADLVICRAGATTLAELAVAGRPALLVPYPHAADDHQRHNAEALAAAGAADVLLDRDLDGDDLARRVQVYAGDRERLAAMGAAARAFGRPDATTDIADIADRLLEGQRVS